MKKWQIPDPGPFFYSMEEDDVKQLLLLLLLLFDVTTLKIARKLVKLQKKNPAGCAREGKQSKLN